jgi:hypothetical protein
VNRQLEAEVAEVGSPAEASARGGSLPGDPPNAVLHAIRFYGPLTIEEVRSFVRVSRREVEAAVEELRLRGEPIVGGNDGLHVTEDPVELEAYVDARRRRIASIYLGCRSLRRTARRMRERADLTLWDVA